MRRSRDEGSTHVLEAMITVMIMMSAIAFVVTFETDGQATAYEVLSEALETRVKDLVNVYFDWPVERALCVGETKGEQWLLDGECRRFCV